MKKVRVYCAFCLILTLLFCGCKTAQTGTEPTIAPKTTEQPEAIEVLEPIATPEPTLTPEPSATPEPTLTSEPSATPEPTLTLEPSTTPEPTLTSEPSATPEPTLTLEPSPTPEPSLTLEPSPTPEPSLTPEPSPTPSPTATPIPIKTLTREPMTGLDAFEIVDHIVVGWNMAHNLECRSDEITYDSVPTKIATEWQSIPPSQEIFETYKAAGFNAVRIPVNWCQQMKYNEVTDTYEVKKEWMDYVKQTVDFAYYLDLIVIIDTHTEDWTDLPEYTEEAYVTSSKIMEDLWSQISETFADYDQALIFECMNEPRQTGLGPEIEWADGDENSWNFLNRLYEVFIRTVRSQGSNANKERLLMLTGYTGQARHLEGARHLDIPVDGGNLAISVHGYEPYQFSISTDEYANYSFPGKCGYGKDYEERLDFIFSELEKLMDEKNVPIIMGEYGASDRDNDEDRVRWITYYLTLAKKAGIPCFWWDDEALNGNGAFETGLLHRRSLKWFEDSVPMMEAMMKVYGIDGYIPIYKFPKRTGFSWNNIPVEKDWKTLFHSEKGTTLTNWNCVELDHWQQYLNGAYDIIVIYDSLKEPTLVLQNGLEIPSGWHHIRSSVYSENAYMLPFSLDDINLTMLNENVKLEDTYAFYVSANDVPMTLYGVYAVPVK